MTDQAHETATAPPAPPREADLTEWVTAPVGNSVYAWDKQRTYQLQGGKWVMIHDGAVIHGTDRTAAPDPDFPGRADEDDPDGHGPEGMTDFTVRMIRGGQLTEKQVRRVATSRARDMAMLDKAGTGAWLGADVNRSGRARLFQASLALSEASGRDADVFYAVTGHHVLDDGRRAFVGGTRVLTAAGAAPDLVVATDSRLAAWTFPDPPPAAELDDALAEVLALTDAADERVMVPQIATAWRALFGVYRDPADPAAGNEVSPTVWCTGATGQGKSSTTAAAVNCGGAPGVRYNTLPFKAGPTKQGGISAPALERILFGARDLCIPFDDLDPSIPVAEARAWQSDFLRRLADQKSRAVAAGPDGLRDARPSRCLAIASGEPLDGEDSAVNRALNLPFERGTVRIGAMREATGADARMIRARFATAIVCELLACYDEARAMLARQRDARRVMFMAGRAESGPVSRGADVAAELMATCDVVLALAVRRGVSEWLAERAREIFERAMLAAWGRHLEIIGATSRARSYVEMVRQALMSGAAYLDDAADPGNPPKGREIASGWRPQIDRMGGLDYQARGNLIGWLNEDDSVWLLPNPATQVARQLADRSGEGFTGTPKTVGETLKADGLLVIHGSAADAQRRAEADLPRALIRSGLGKRAWHISAAAWTADGDDSGAESGGGGAPTAPTSQGGAPTAAPTSIRALTWGAPTAPTENPDFAPPQGAAPTNDEVGAPVLTCENAPAPTGSAVGAGAVGASAPTGSAGSGGGSGGNAPSRAAWLEAARGRGTFRTDAQWAALEEATAHLDAPDIADHPQRLRVLARLEGDRKQSGPFAPRRRGDHPFPYWQAPLPPAAADIRISDGWTWERPGYDGPVTALDRSGAWPTALSSVTVAHGPLAHTGEVDADAGTVRPGYYLVTYYAWPETGLPHPLGDLGKPGSPVLITAPDMALLRDLYRAGRWPDATAADSWTGDPARLSDWAHFVGELRRYAIERHGRESGAYAAVKTAFGMATSLMLGKWGDGNRKVWECKCRRADWVHHVKRQSAVTLWRAADDCLTMTGPELGPVGLRNNDELVIPSGALEAVTTATVPGKDRPAVRLDPDGITLGTFKVKSEG
jgi:hypothetical protein